MSVPEMIWMANL